MENILKWCLFVIYEIYIFDSKGDLKFSYNAEGLIREEVVNRFKKLIETPTTLMILPYLSLIADSRLNFSTSEIHDITKEYSLPI